MKFRQFLLRLHLWRRFRRERTDKKRLKEKIRTQKSRHDAQVKSLKAFYEKRLEVLAKRAQIREDALIDRLMHAFKLMGVGHLTVDVAKEVEVSPLVQEPPTEPNESPIEQLTPDQQDYVQDYLVNFRQMGMDAGQTEADIHRLWLSEYRDKAVDEAMNRIEQ